MQMHTAARTLLYTLMAAAAAMLVFCQASHAEDITLKLKGGGGFQISGELKSFDGKKYVIINPSFGKMEVDATRFDCITDTCPKGPVTPTPSIASLFSSGKPPVTVVTGSNTIGSRLMPNLIKAYAEKLKLQAQQVVQSDPLTTIIKFVDDKGVEIARVIVNSHGSSTSFAALKTGEAQIGMSSRPVKNAEAANLRAAGLGNMRSPDHEHTIGLDGLIIVTSPDNPAISMSIENIANVFSGKVTDWAQLGFPPGPINVYAPGPDSGTWETFNTLVLKPQGVKLTDKARRTENHAEQSDWIAADPLGIGVVGIAYQRSAKPLNIAASCGLITPPSSFAIKTGEYPLARSLYLYTPGRPAQALAAGLLDFVRSQEAQPVVQQTYFVDQSPEIISFADLGSRVAYALNAPQEDFDLDLMREFLTDLKNAGRLTFTFRFNSGSFTLDSLSRRYISRVVSLMQDGILKDKSIKLVGFADSGGAFNANLSLSQSRAEAVRRALLKASNNRIEVSRFTVRGYGELAPVACNSTAQGKAYNRRVEVWIDEDQ